MRSLCTNRTDTTQYAPHFIPQLVGVIYMSSCSARWPEGDALAGSFESAHSLNRPSRLILGKFIPYSMIRLTDKAAGPHLHTS